MKIQLHFKGTESFAIWNNFWNFEIFWTIGKNLVKKQVYIRRQLPTLFSGLQSPIPEEASKEANSKFARQKKSYQKSEKSMESSKKFYDCLQVPTLLQELQAITRLGLIWGQSNGVGGYTIHFSPQKLKMMQIAVNRGLLDRFRLTWGAGDTRWVNMGPNRLVAPTSLTKQHWFFHNFKNSKNRSGWHAYDFMLTTQSSQNKI